MTNRSERRAERRAGPRPRTQSQGRAGLRLLVLLAVIGLILLAVASQGALGTAAPTPSPIL